MSVLSIFQLIFFQIMIWVFSIKDSVDRFSCLEDSLLLDTIIFNFWDLHVEPDMSEYEKPQIVFGQKPNFQYNLKCFRKGIKRPLSIWNIYVTLVFAVLFLASKTAQSFFRLLQLLSWRRRSLQISLDVEER